MGAKLDSLGTDAEVAAALAAVGIGAVFRVAASSLRGDWCPCISHATAVGGARTLCGLDCSDWTQDPAHHAGPDCLRCAKRWEKLLREGKG